MIITEPVHTFKKSEVNFAEHLLQKRIISIFGEVWTPPEDAQYKGKEWICRSPIGFEAGIWRLCESARHAGAIRAFGKIEKRELGTILRIMVFYKKDEELRA